LLSHSGISPISRSWSLMIGAFGGICAFLLPVVGLIGLGRVDKLDPAADCCELHEPEEAGRELVVAGRHAA
jgi:hypothetical protein